jgi:hypothetical protein
MIGVAAACGMHYACARVPNVAPGEVVFGATPPVAIDSGPADQATICREIARARGQAQQQASRAYRPQVSLLRELMGGQRPSQVVKGTNLEQALFDKELRRIAERNGVTFEFLQTAATAERLCGEESTTVRMPYRER